MAAKEQEVTEKEAAELIVLLLSAFDNVLKVDEDYTRKMKRQ